MVGFGVCDIESLGSVTEELSAPLLPPMALICSISLNRKPGSRIHDDLQYDTVHPD